MERNEIILRTKEAIAQHMRWRMLLQLNLEVQQQYHVTTEKKDQLLHTESCAMGRWLGALETTRLRGRAAYEELDRAHTQFHCELAYVEFLVNGGYEEQATRALRADSSYANAARAFASAITAFQAAYGLRTPIAACGRRESAGKPRSASGSTPWAHSAPPQAPVAQLPAIAHQRAVL